MSVCVCTHTHTHTQTHLSNICAGYSLPIRIRPGILCRRHHHHHHHHDIAIILWQVVVHLCIYSVLVSEDTRKNIKFELTQINVGVRFVFKGVW